MNNKNSKKIRIVTTIGLWKTIKNNYENRN